MKDLLITALTLTLLPTLVFGQCWTSDLSEEEQLAVAEETFETDLFAESIETAKCYLDTFPVGKFSEKMLFLKSESLRKSGKHKPAKKAFDELKNMYPTSKFLKMSGIMTEKEYPTIIDPVTGLTWHVEPDLQKHSWISAKRYCRNLSLADYSDWRNPSKDEMLDMSDKNRFIFSGNMETQLFWTSTKNLSDPESVWLVNINSNSSKNTDKTHGIAFAACVRGAKNSQYTNLKIKLMGTVIDKSTGLMWQKKTENKKRDWEDAKRFCDELSLGGYSDWRMPALEVLADMVDEKSDLFSQYKLNSKYWVSSDTCKFLDGNNKCIVDFFNGYSSDKNKREGMYVRCVRGIK